MFLFYIGLALKVVAPKPRARNCPFFALLNGCACVTLHCYIYLLFALLIFTCMQPPTPAEPKKAHVGRKAGVPNKTTTQVREALHSLLNENLERMRDDLNKMAPATRVKLLLEMAKFVVPTYKAIDITSGGDAITGRSIQPLTIVLSHEASGEE